MEAVAVEDVGVGVEVGEAVAVSAAGLSLMTVDMSMPISVCRSASAAAFRYVAVVGGSPIFNLLSTFFAEVDGGLPRQGFLSERGRRDMYAPHLQHHETPDE